MDRSKPTTGFRSSKAKAQQPPTDLFALGTKGTAVAAAASNVPKSVNVPSKAAASRFPAATTATATTSKLVKRENASVPLAQQPPAKKIKKETDSQSITSSILSDLNTVDVWGSNVLECDAEDLISNVTTLLKTNDTRKAVGFVAGALKKISSSLRFKSEHTGLVHNLIKLVKSNSFIFTNEQIIHMMCSIIRNENLPKPKTSILTSTTSLNSNSVQLILFSVNILLKAHQTLDEWPDSFIRLYVDDALGERIWIDHEDCKVFVENILTAFKTKVPPKSYFQSELGPLMPIPSSGVTGTGSSASMLKMNEFSSTSTLYSINNDKIFVELFQKTGDEDCGSQIRDRFLHCTDLIEKIVLEATREQLPKRVSAPELINRNFIKFLTATCGLVNIRILAVSRLEAWLHNPKLMRPAQELLGYCFCNCWNGPDTIDSQKDIEIITNLVKMRLKTKALITIYMNCFREMLASNFDENCLSVFMKQTVTNEISSSRNPNNVQMLITMFQQYNKQNQYLAETVFGAILVEVNKEENSLKAIRSLFRDLVRGLRFEFNMYEVFRVILQFASQMVEFHTIVDLLCFSVLILASNPQIRSINMSTMLSSTYLLSNFRKQVSMIQKEAVVWLYNHVVSTEKPDQLNSMLRKILFLEPIDTYVDIWPGESEQRIQLVRLVSESIPVQQETILHICKMGVSKSYFITPTEALDLLDVLIRRTAVAVSSSITCTTDNTISNLPSLNILINVTEDNLDVIEALLSLTEYRYPENVILPPNYEPPQLAITALYWKAWTLILILVSHNPQTMGKTIWEQFPTVRSLIEMCITNSYVYTTSPEDQSNILQLNAIDKEKILELETHLASNTITEQTSLLLSQVIVMRIHDKMYQNTPVGYFDQLEQLNRQYKLGHLLCRSRNPDFLLDIIQMQQSQQMPWLIDLVHNSPISHLPVQCLCEYVLYVNSNNSVMAQKAASSTYDMNGPLTHLRAIVKNEDLLAESFEILEYFFRRLGNLLNKSRSQTLQALKMVLNDTTDSNEWLTVTISKSLINIYKNENMISLRSMIMVMLRQACLVETDPKLLALYIQFLCDDNNYGLLSTSDLGDLILDLSQLIVERNSILVSTIQFGNVVKNLMSIFSTYMQKIRGPQRDAFVWSECQDLILVTWPTTGQECTVNILIVHASIILLTYENKDSGCNTAFTELLNLWFPLNEQPPKSYLVDTSEEALLIPDWLKLRMIRSDVPRLVDMSLMGLEAGQLVLFMQSFGISVNSMSLLLRALDRMSIGPEAISIQDAVIDKSYMMQLVNVQHLRGAKGGEKFLKLLDPSYNKAMPDFMREYDFRQCVRRKLLEQKSTQTSQFGRMVVNEGSNFGNEKQRLRKLLQSMHSVRNNELEKNSFLNMLQGIISQFSDQNFEIISRHVQTVLKCNLKQRSSIKMEVVENKPIEMDTAKVKSSNNDFALQIYRSNMTNLHTYAEELLQKDEQLSLCNISKTLNFLQALIGNPRLWRGRDKNAVIKPIFAQEITILKSLIKSDRLLKKMVDYILIEAASDNQFLESRISLLFNCFETNSNQWALLMDYVNGKVQDTSLGSEMMKIVRLFQLMIYMRLPKVVNHQISVDSLINDIDTCDLDRMCHTTLTAFISTITNTRKGQHQQNVQTNNINLSSLELMIRKIVVTHPIVFLRQLPVIATSLRGKSYLDFSALKGGHHLMLFKRILNILELLQPHIFDKVYRSDLASIMKSYLDLVEKHDQNKEMNLISSKISEILNRWLKHSGLEWDLLEFLQKSQKIPKNKVMELITELPDEPEPFLVNKIISEIKNSQSVSSSSAGCSTGDNSLSLDNYLDSTKFLDYENYCKLLLSSSSETRSWAYVQILKYLRKNPNDAVKSKSLIFAIFNCLDVNQNHDALSALLDNLPDLIIYLQEYAWPILKTLFSMNINSNVNSADVIIRIVEEFNLQSGC